MHVQSILIVCPRSTSVNNGPPKPSFPAALSMASRKQQMDTSGSEVTEVCSVSTVLISGPSRLLRSPPLRTFPYCSCLRTPAENCGSVHRGPISCANKSTSLRASDTAYSQSPPCQKITTAECSYPTSSRELSVSRPTTFRNWDPLHRQ